MTRSVTGALPLPAPELLEKARDAAARNQVALEGDELAGKFSGHGFEGRYLVRGAEITLTVTRKPFIMPWFLVEQALQRLFHKQPS